MCHFVTVVVPKNIDFNYIKKVFSRYHRDVNIIENRHVRNRLNINEVYIYPAKKMCDCGTPLGTLEQSFVQERVSLSEIKNLQKKGWSKQKIGRWLNEKEKYNKRELRLYQDRVSSISTDTDPDNWVSISRDICNYADGVYIGILLHWYGGGLDAEKIEIEKRINIKLDNDASTHLLKMHEDQLLVLKNDG